MIQAPDSIDEFAALIRRSRKLIAVGARTKPALSIVSDDVHRISTRNLSGMVDYDPAEFTFTAKAGTPLREIVSTLAERGQYLPFDPPLVEAGATVGGTVAAGLSGPGRFRFGGIRDFILAVEFLDGNGTRLRGGAKVVKNAAGFDLPKFFVGSRGRFGVLTEVTLKVFPCPPAMQSFRIPCTTPAAAVAALAAGTRSRREFDALDYSPENAAILARMRGTVDALDALGADLRREFPEAERINDAIWSDITELRFASASAWLAKCPTTLGAMAALISDSATRDARCHISGGGSFAWIHGPESVAIDGVRVMTLREGTRPLSQDAEATPNYLSRLRDAFDPLRRFA